MFAPPLEHVADHAIPQLGHDVKRRSCRARASVREGALVVVDRDAEAIERGRSDLAGVVRSPVRGLELASAADLGGEGAMVDTASSAVRPDAEGERIVRESQGTVCYFAAEADEWSGGLLPALGAVLVTGDGEGAGVNPPVAVDVRTVERECGFGALQGRNLELEREGESFGLPIERAHRLGGVPDAGEHLDEGVGVLRGESANAIVFRYLDGQRGVVLETEADGVLEHQAQDGEHGAGETELAGELCSVDEILEDWCRDFVVAHLPDVREDVLVQRRAVGGEGARCGVGRSQLLECSSGELGDSSTGADVAQSGDLRGEGDCAVEGEFGPVSEGVELLAGAGALAVLVDGYEVYVAPGLCTGGKHAKAEGAGLSPAGIPHVEVGLAGGESADRGVGQVSAHGGMAVERSRYEVGRRVLHGIAGRGGRRVRCAPDPSIFLASIQTIGVELAERLETLMVARLTVEKQWNRGVSAFLPWRSVTRWAERDNHDLIRRPCPTIPALPARTTAVGDPCGGPVSPEVQR